MGLDGLEMLEVHWCQDHHCSGVDKPLQTDKLFPHYSYLSVPAQFALGLGFLSIWRRGKFLMCQILYPTSYLSSNAP